MTAQSLSRFLPRVVVALALSWSAGLTAGRADTIVYNNIVTIVGNQANGSATSATGNTALLADDITFLAGYSGFKVTSFTLAVANASATETASLTVEFFMTDGTGGGPGTLLSSYSTGAIAFGNGLTPETFAAPTLFTIPTYGKIWAGFYFTGAAGGSMTALNSLGVYNEENTVTMSPNVGSSTASYFSGTAPAGTGGNPAGGILTNPSTGQNFGITVAVPEPASALFALAGGVALVGMIVRRRSRATRTCGS